KTLFIRNKEKSLSSGEKKLFDSACQLIITELAYVKRMEIEEASLIVRGILKKSEQESEEESIV
ncbi:hypothetical protein KKB54_05245, partial [bacterium]|nr:hypothetical protein [bacterium]